MKIASRITRLLTVSLFFSLLFLSCEKNESASSTPAEKEEFAIATSEADAEAEVIFDDVFNNVLGVNKEVGIGGTGVFSRPAIPVSSENATINSIEKTYGVDTTACFSVSFVQASNSSRFPLTVTIDFGRGCTGRDGKVRKGKLVIAYTGPLFIPKNSATTSFEGFAIDNVQVQGTHKIINEGSQDKKAFKVIITRAKLSKDNGNFSEWNSERTITQAEGGLTPFIALDDAFTITGKASGSVQKDDKFFQWSTEITEALVKKFACRWIVKGSLSFRKSNATELLLDYGTGNCDNKAIFTLNGQAREISLH